MHERSKCIISRRGISPCQYAYSRSTQMTHEIMRSSRRESHTHRCHDSTRYSQNPPPHRSGGESNDAVSPAVFSHLVCIITYTARRRGFLGPRARSGGRRPAGARPVARASGITSACVGGRTPETRRTAHRLWPGLVRSRTELMRGCKQGRAREASRPRVWRASLPAQAVRPRQSTRCCAVGVGGGHTPFVFALRGEGAGATVMYL